ncbi:thioredoxin-interacting protein [Gadus morhua]|uniref:Thioredoxin-interacting protein n=1 Tax=Gadus morhua TaxID=8049 RepID=A0A8C4Z937_GADMO|nr:thioredoxin-interacting protein-like [Gadus morhua]
MVVMKKLKTFEVVFSDPSKAFYCSGDKVAGNVVVEVSEVTKVSVLKVLGVGCGKVEYAKGKQKCREEIDYLKYEEVVHLDNQTRAPDGSFTLRPGNKYEFMFGFELPAPGCLVSSYAGKFGYVRYYVRAVMERPCAPPQHCEKSFEVEEPLDINTPDLLAPVAASKHKKVSCLFIPDGQVSISARIDRKGFCEGEEISLNAKFENSCSRIVVPKAAIVAKHSYQAGGRVKVLKQKLTSVRGNHIISGMCDMWQGRTIRVPKLQPSLQGCDIIKVDYVLMVYVHIPGSDKMVVELPLVIGTGPFGGFSSRSSSVSSQVSSLRAPSDSWASFPSPPPSYANIPGSYPNLPSSYPNLPSYSNLPRLDGDITRTPLLHDCDEDEDEDGLFMLAPPQAYPLPPPYSEVDESVPSGQQVIQVF